MEPSDPFVVVKRITNARTAFRLSKGMLDVLAIQSYRILAPVGAEKDLLRHGYVYVHDGAEREDNVRKEATFFILGADASANARAKAENIMKYSGKLNCEGVVIPWFTTYSQTMGNWIVAYEQVEGIYDFQSLPVYDDDKRYLNELWRENIRFVLETLKSMKSCSVSHGSLNARNSYVLCQGRLKLINVSSERNVHYDLQNLASFLEGYLREHPEWASFRELIAFERVRVEDLLEHPFLHDPEGRLSTLRFLVGKIQSSWGLQRSVKKAMNEKFPEYHQWHTMVTEEPFLGVYVQGGAATQHGQQVVGYKSDAYGLIRFMSNVSKHACHVQHQTGETGYVPPREREIWMTKTFPRYLAELYTACKIAR